MNNDSSQGRKYAVGEQVARGGMGAILSVRDIAIGRTVAMKVMLDGRRVREADRLRFLREAQILGQLEHPNIVPMHELGVDEHGQPYYTMKFVQGVTLKEIINQLKTGDAETVAKYPLTQLLTVFQKVCDAVAFAHSKGIVHRDLKPENVMLGGFGEVLVLDWGLAKILSERGRAGDSAADQAVGEMPPSHDRSHEEGGDGSPQPFEGGAHGATRPTQAGPEAGAPEEGFHELDKMPGDAALTLEGQVMGTPQFMAPEQAEGRVHDIDERTDIFSLGGILYSLLTLRPPTGGTTVKEVLENVKSGYIAPPTIYNKARTRSADGSELDLAINLMHCPANRIPDSLSAVCMKAMAVNPTERYQTVPELQAEITAYQGGFATSAERASFWTQLVLLAKRNRTASVAALLILGLTSVFVAKLIDEKRRVQATLTELRRTAPTFYTQARALTDTKDFSGALEKLDYAITLDPRQADYHLWRGHLLQSSMRFAEAKAAYQEARRLDPNLNHVGENIALSDELLQGHQGGQPPLGALEKLRLAMIRQGRSSEALALAAKMGTAEQQSFEACKAVLEKAGIKGILSKEPAGGLSLDLRQSNISDLSPLAALPLTSLNLYGTPVYDLGPLRGMRLRQLNLANTKVSSLDALMGMPLQELLVDETKVTDLTPLKGMFLTRLDAGVTAISDLRPLAGMPLTDLRVHGTKVADLTPLHGMQLTYLHLGQTPVTDLSPLEGMPLNSLFIPNTRVTDLRPLKGMPLTTLWLEGCTRIRDLAPLANCQQLEILLLPYPPPSDIEFLRRFPKLKQLSYRLPADGIRKIPPVQEFWKAYDARKGKR